MSALRSSKHLQQLIHQFGRRAATVSHANGQKKIPPHPRAHRRPPRRTSIFHNHGSGRDNNQSVYCRTSLPREPGSVARLFAVVGDEHIRDMIGISKPSKLCRRHLGLRLCDAPTIHLTLYELFPSWGGGCLRFTAQQARSKVLVGYWLLSTPSA
jgi:hypothetical protein